jgi:hypothetical protein
MTLPRNPALERRGTIIKRPFLSVVDRIFSMDQNGGTIVGRVIPPGLAIGQRRANVAVCCTGFTHPPRGIVWRG